jgi:hypothetical protein
VLAEMALAFGKSAESMQDQGLTIVRSLLDRGILEPQSSPTEHGH